MPITGQQIRADPGFSIVIEMEKRAITRRSTNQKARFRYGRLGLLVLGFCLPVLLIGGLLSAQDYTEAPISYLKTSPSDLVADLQKKVDSGQAQLKFDSKHGYLLSVLQALHVPVSSQMLVFSKTSFQRDRISPQSPRAVYFNDRVYVGWVQDGDYVEVASADPQLGAVFYILKQEPTDKPQFKRQTYECLQCHDSNLAGSVPGHLMRSIYPDRTGNPIFSAGSYVTSDQSPLGERWGGWYVTGRHPGQFHMGNMVAQSEAEPQQTDWAKGGNLTDLSKVINVSPYLSKHSDIVALMVAEHQTQIQNRITRANYGTRQALQYAQLLNKDLGRAPDFLSDSVKSRIKSVCEPLVKAMLFVGETKLTAPITGTSGFAAQFAGYGPFDKQKRSLREFDLQTRLFRYPLSYQVYSATFDGLPDIAKQYIYSRFEEILTGKDMGADWAHLSAADRRALLKILRDTKPEFACWEEKQKR